METGPASRLLLSVNLLAGLTLREGFALVNHNSRETHSMIGATVGPTFAQFQTAEPQTILGGDNCRRAARKTTLGAAARA